MSLLSCGQGPILLLWTVASTGSVCSALQAR